MLNITPFPQAEPDKIEKLERAAIYIPAFNAASTLPRVFERIPEKIRKEVAEILVVDNASSDDTSLMAFEFKGERGFHNLEIVRNKKNEGYGGSQKIAYRRAIDRNYECIAMLHGDAQYAPELLGNLLEPILSGKLDMVFGSRMAGDPLKGGMPWVRYLGNRFLTRLQNQFLGMNLSEFHSGYRVYSVAALKKIPFERLSSDFHFDTEIIILLRDKGLRIGEIAIPTYYGNEKNYVNIWHYGIDVVVTTLTYALHKLKIRKSKNWSRILGSV